MGHNQFALLKERRFWPLFGAQFLGAFHDNLFKSALTLLLLYGTVAHSDQDPKLLVTVAAGLFILPFVLFSVLGGQLADKFPKDRVIQYVKLAEIGVAVLAVISLVSGFVPLMLLSLFSLGAQSSFFGPSKYAILPQLLDEKELIGGNALMNVGVFLAILLGTIFGALSTSGPGFFLICALILACSVTGYLASRQLPETKATVPDLQLKFNLPVETFKIIRTVANQKRGIYLSILGIAWFYFLGGMFLAQFPNYARETLGVNEYVLTLFLVVFSVGIGIGGLLNNRLLRSRVEATYVPLAALGITVFALDLYFASGGIHPDPSGTMRGFGAFLGTFAAWRILFDMFLIAVCGGMFVVPLNAIVQHNAADEIRARILAGSAILNALFIVGSSVLSGLLFIIGFEVRDLFVVYALCNAAVAVYICGLIPEYLFKSLLQGLFKLLYKVEVRGLENFEKAGDRVVIVGNHVSFLDPPLLAAFLPGKPMFAINTEVAKWWWVRPWLRLIDAFPLDPTNPFSTKSLIKEVMKDKQCVIFPEGRLTETGGLMKVYEGPGMIADKSEAMVLPVRLDGVQHSPFSRLKGKVPLRKFPKIIITILEPRKFTIDDEIRGRARRAAAGRQLHKIMEDMMFLTEDREQSLFGAMMKARYVNGDDSVICEDVERKPLKFRKLIQGSILLGSKFAQKTEKGENVGVMLPNSCGAVVTFFALQAFGRVPAMLNFSAGAQALVSAINTAQIKTVLTSRRFVELGRLTDIVDEMAGHTEIVYLEDVRKDINFGDKVFGFLSPVFASYLHRRQDVKPDDPAVVLFTSGSEGAPKGVVLSHCNLMTNVVQLTARVDFNRQDIVFNCLPMFHSFGLTGGTLLPVLSGVKTFLYPSPLHYRIVPELIYASNATIMFGTDTFLNGYARMANPYDFYRMRYIFAGAEKVKEETRELYMDRFGVRILEGYGATETSPVIAVNSPMHTKAGTVGRFLPGVTYRLEDVPGVDEGGRLFVSGPNVMLGYLKADNPGVLEPTPEGWHDTGDIVDVDAEGYVRILGRAKRFAKIAGEMVSLTSVEAMAQAVWPGAEHAVVSIPDSRKGEQLVLVTTEKEAAREALSSYASENGVTELAVPKTILSVDKMPVLGTGKVDYVGVKMFVDQKLQKAA